MTESRDEVAGRLRRAGVGTWELDASRQVVALDDVARELFGVTDDLTQQQMLEMTRPSDRAVLLGAFGAPGGESRSSCEFHVSRGDGEEILVRMAGAIGGASSAGIVFVPPTEDGPSQTREQWLGEFAEAFSRALTVYDVAQVAQQKGKELLGADFTGLAEYGEENSNLTLVSADALPLPIKQRWTSFPATGKSPTAQVFLERQARFYPNRERLLGVYPHLTSEFDELSVRSWAGMPLVVSDRTVGAMCMHWSEPRRFDTEEIQLLTALAGQVAQTLERARLYERQQVFGLTLQQTVLPRSMPEIPGIELAGRYLPAEKGLEMGGDWYDAFTVPSGELILVVGDVVGHGGPTAALMGQLRNAARAYALEGHGPSGILARLNTLVEAMYQGSYATILCVRLDPVSGRMCWANAGHPPLVIEHHGNVEQLGYASDPLVGALEAHEYTQHDGYLPPGASLMLYSDGLVQDRQQSITSGLERLADVARERWHTILDVRCSQILERVLGERVRTDDLCFLMARRQGDGEERARLELPATLQSPSEARDFVSRTLREWGLSNIEDTALLLVSEVVTNAVVHARSAPRVVLSLDPESLVVSVHDQSPLPPVRRRASLSATNGRGMALVDSMADRWGVDPTTGGKDVWFELHRDREESSDEMILLDPDLLAEIEALTAD